MTVELYTAPWCGYCDAARRLLERAGVAYEEVEVGRPGFHRMLEERTGAASVPQVLVDGRPIGGYPELAALLRTL